MAAAGTAGMAIAGGLAAGWNVIGLVAENLPWIGVAYHMLNEVADIVDTKNAMQVCFFLVQYRKMQRWFSQGLRKCARDFRFFSSLVVVRRVLLIFQNV